MQPIDIINSQIIEQDNVIYTECLVSCKTSDQEMAGQTWKGRSTSMHIPVRTYSQAHNQVNNKTRAIFFVHGGPDICIGDYTESVFTKFFVDLVKQGFTVIAPEIRSSSENGGIDACTEFNGQLYKNDIIDVIQAFKIYLSLEKAVGMFHSLGVHQAGNAILDQTAILDAVIYIAGDSYTPAGHFYFYAKELGLNVDALDFSTEENVTDLIFNQLGGYVHNRIHHSNQYGNFPDRSGDFLTTLETPMVDENFAKKISYGDNIDKTPKIPYLVLHCINDGNVPFSLSAKLVDEMKSNGNQVYGLFSKEGKHSWFKNDTNYNQETYNYMLPKIVAFLNGDFNLLNDIEMDKEVYENSSVILKNFGIIDIVDQHRLFFNGETVSFNHEIIDDDSVKLNLKYGIDSFLQQYQMFLDKLQEVFFAEFSKNKVKLGLDEDNTNYYLELFERERANLTRLKQARQERTIKNEPMTYLYDRSASLKRSCASNSEFVDEENTHAGNKLRKIESQNERTGPQ